MLSSCATPVRDFIFCAKVPGNMGAVCDNFLTPNQQILTEDAWDALQESWESQGYAVECTTSDAVGNLKAEIEQLCSKASCDYKTKAVLKALVKMHQTALETLR